MKRYMTAAALMASAFVLGNFFAAKAVEPVKMSAKQVRELVLNAKTPADHLKLAAWYKDEADRLDTEAADHETLVDIYKRHPSVLGSKGNVPISGSAMHCMNLATSLRGAAKAYRELASEHEVMAKGAVQ